MGLKSSNWILYGIVAGIAAAFGGVALFGQSMLAVEWLGELFLKALRMIIIPLVMASIVSGVAGLGDVRKLGRLGGVTILYYAVTTTLAVGLGVLLVNIIQPGRGMDLAAMGTPEQVMSREPTGVTDIILSLFSENIIHAMAEMEILPVIVFSIVLAAALSTLGSKGKTVVDFFEGLNEAIMKIVHALMWFAPIGVFGLVAGRFARAGDIGSLVGGLGKYMGTVLLGLAVHSLIALPLLLWIFAKRNPVPYLRNMATPILTAFSTASSSATLPLTIEAVSEGNRVARKVAYFVLPVGATVNMDGTALYESVAAIFIAQALGVELSGVQQILIFITATLAAIGAAGIPEAGLVTLVIVLGAVGLPSDGIGLILAVDWLLDRFRTAINVWGDSCGAAIVERQAGLTEPLEQQMA